MTTFDNAIIVRRDNARAIRFRGDRVATVSTSPDRASPDYSGVIGCWTELALYRTAGGRLVCERIERTSWQGERDRHSGAVCTEHDAVISFFGLGALAQDLYARSGIDAAENVD